MKALVCLVGLLAFRAVFANDHNNLEHGRPLLFDDAYSIAFGEREFQFGLNSSSGKLGLMSSLAYGFAKNQEFSIGFDAAQGSSNVGEFSYFRNVSREFEHAPALGFRVTANVTRGSRPSTQFRLVATKAWHQYDKVHLNLDFETNLSPGAILGYSTPLGYPKKFDQTLVSEISLRSGQASFGVGIRRQLDPRSVLDFGVRSGKQVHLTAGYSIAF